MPAPTNSGEVRKRIEGLNPLSRARKEHAPGIPRDMMRGKSAQSADSPLLVEEAFPHLNGKVEIYYVGTTIGSHTGPGTVALFFWGDERTA